LSAIINRQALLPSISQTFLALIDVFSHGEFYLSLLFTLLRSIVAFLVSFILAFTFAYFSYKKENFKLAITPIIRVLRALPTIAVVLLLLVWTNSQIAPVIVTMLVVLPTLYTNVLTAFSEIDKDALEMCAVFSVDKKQTLFKVSIPQILPSMLIAVGAGISLNIKLMVAAEVLSYTSQSIGYFLHISRLYDETATMIALVIVTVIIGVIIEWGFGLLSKKVGKWQ
jgi:NitT/TauT family transport system permease protein